MLTIENIDKLSNCIGYNTWVVVADTHYAFHIAINGKKIEVTLGRHKPKYLHDKPHPHSNQYLLQCHHVSWQHFWLFNHEIKDIWMVTHFIEKFINEIK